MGRTNRKIRADRKEYSECRKERQGEGRKGTGPVSRSGFQVMAGLIGMIRPLLMPMAAAILMGCAGNLAASFITISGGYGLLAVGGFRQGAALPFLFAAMAVLAAARGILRYAEQACNHYIAFKLLARIRHQVFESLRKLAPAKLDGSEKGNLISILTSDIDQLEVFYAHTISPVVIAVVTSAVMCVFIGSMYPLAGVLAGVFYGIVGIAVPCLNSRKGAFFGRQYREGFGNLNTAVLDNLYGLEEILQYHRQADRMEQMKDKSRELEKISHSLKKRENRERNWTDSMILTAGILMMAVCGFWVQEGSMEFWQAVTAVIAMMSSFGPVAALSALSNNLNQTLASGSRVLELLEEEPAVAEIRQGITTCEGDISCMQVTFGYGEKEKRAPVLREFQAEFTPGKIHGIFGKSGCGKSTLLKLLMRFYETDTGNIRYGGADVGQIATNALRRHISYVTQETFLFQDTVENNIKTAEPEATREEVIEAAKKASVHDFIMSLPEGYDTKITETGDSLSGGERQRIGIARAFLHKSKWLFLDEPTSNIDSLNEGMILKSLEQEKLNRSVLLVSHRKSTMGIAENVISM